MDAKKTRYIIILLAAALVALIGIQLYWVNNAYTMRQNALTVQVKEALFEVARQVEDNYACMETFSMVRLKPGTQFMLLTRTPSVNNNQHASIDSVPMYLKYDTNLYNFNKIRFKHASAAEIVMKFELQDNADSIIDDSGCEGDPNCAQLAVEDYKNRLASNKPIQKKIDLKMLDSLLNNSLNETGAGNYYYGFIRLDTNTVEYASKGANIEKLQKSAIFTPFLNDKYFSKPYRLALYFENESAKVFSSLWMMLVLSATIILLLVYAFYYFVKTLQQQKRLSEMKTDFINNMTHEFRTPLTNISLALETIGTNGSSGVKPPIQRILHIIGEENHRLTDNVERILQIATIDKYKIQLKPELINLHALITDVAGCFELTMLAQGGTMETALNATESKVIADETHLANVLHNLLDNAIKYSTQNPKINIRTHNKWNGIILTVQDNGIGMNQLTQKRIFDQFYRAHTGNRHDVKGFGIGLSYVKSIVEAHKGKIDVTSEPGTGSCFSIFLPFDFLKI